MEASSLQLLRLVRIVQAECDPGQRESVVVDLVHRLGRAALKELDKLLPDLVNFLRFKNLRLLSQIMHLKRRPDSQCNEEDQ